MSRDNQRQRAYDAENQVAAQLRFAAQGARTVSVAGSTLVLPLEVIFGSHEAVQVWVDTVRSTDWFGVRWPLAARAPLTVRARRGNRAAEYEPPGVLALPEPSREGDWALRQLVVTHELAHHAAHHDLRCSNHGPDWAGAFADLATHALAPEVGLALHAAFADHGVAASGTASSLVPAVPAARRRP